MPTDYTLMDATSEILIMLLAAFLLGWLFCWLMKKLFGVKESDPVSNNYATERVEPGMSSASANVGAARLRGNQMERPDMPTANLDVNAPDVNVSTPDVDLNAPGGSRPSVNIPDLKAPDVDVSDIAGRGKASIGKGIGAAAAGVGAVAAGAVAMKDSAGEKLAGMAPEADLTQPDLPANQQAGAAFTGGNADGLVQDDLTRISGIDGTVADILHSKGVHSYATLQQVDRATLKGYLDSSGDPSMRLIEPASWPHQARLCGERNWSKLADYQSFLSGNQLDPVAPAPDNGAPSSHRDDLKKIEGIGPIFEGLLNEAGIHSYQQLSESSRDSLKAIIDAGGSEYRMHEPETWPYQARLAAQGDWQKLKEYIQFMTGRN